MVLCAFRFFERIARVKRHNELEDVVPLTDRRLAGLARTERGDVLGDGFEHRLEVAIVIPQRQLLLLIILSIIEPELRAFKHKIEDLVPRQNHRIFALDELVVR